MKTVKKIMILQLVMGKLLKSMENCLMQKIYQKLLVIVGITNFFQV